MTKTMSSTPLKMKKTRSKEQVEIASSSSKRGASRHNHLQSKYRHHHVVIKNCTSLPLRWRRICIIPKATLTCSGCATHTSWPNLNFRFFCIQCHAGVRRQITHGLRLEFSATIRLSGGRHPRSPGELARLLCITAVETAWPSLQPNVKHVTCRGLLP